MSQNQIDVLQAELKFRGMKFTKLQVKDIISAVSDTFLDFARNGESFHIPYVGRFEVRTYKPKKVNIGYNGSEMYVGERKRVKFVPSQALKRAADQAELAQGVTDEEES